MITVTIATIIIFCEFHVMKRLGKIGLPLEPDSAATVELALCFLVYWQWMMQFFREYLGIFCNFCLVHIVWVYLFPLKVYFDATLNSINSFLFLFFFFNIYLFIYLFLAALGLHCCVRAFSSCGEQGLLFVAVCGLLFAVASVVAEHGL